MIKRTIAALLAALCSTQVAQAFEVNNAQIVEFTSFDAGGHFWVRTTNNTNCTNPNAWFVLPRWDDQPEPIKTQRLVMYQAIMMAYAMGKTVRVLGASCYLDSYLRAEQIVVSE